MHGGSTPARQMGADQGMRVIPLQRLPAALAGVPSGARVVAAGNFATPRTLLTAVDGVLDRYCLHLLNAQLGLPRRPGVRHETAFVGPGVRSDPDLIYVPCRLSMVPLLYAAHCPPDVVLLHTSTPRRGTVSLGIEVNVLPAAIAAARAGGGLVIAQANPQMPYTFGDAQLPLDAIDVMVEVDEPLPTHAPTGSRERSRLVGERIADLIPDGATVQLGIGAIPDAVLSRLTGRSGLRVWSEMISDGVLDLHECGALDRSTPIVASFAFGSLALYRWLDGNEGVRMLRTECTNDPAQIASQPLMVSVNAALQVDLFDQANASRIGARIHSGFGGATDFTVGALHAPGGQAIVGLPSWHDASDSSTIVPLLSSPVTSVQHSHVVTDCGVASMFGRSQREQARSLIDRAAHPAARDHLAEQGHLLGLT